MEYLGKLWVCIWNLNQIYKVSIPNIEYSNTNIRSQSSFIAVCVPHKFVNVCATGFSIQITLKEARLELKQEQNYFFFWL